MGRAMGRAFTRLAFSRAVKAAQARYGARAHGARLEAAAGARDRLDDDIVAFVAGVDSFFVGTASSAGIPHVQHRGGPAGFLKVIDRQTLAFADYAGNRQYITVGNLSENDQVMLLLIDYETGRRLKIWGRAAAFDADPALLAQVTDADYPAAVERVIRVEVLAFDLNCRQHIPKLVRKA